MKKDNGSKKPVKKQVQEEDLLADDAEFDMPSDEEEDMQTVADADDYMAALAAMQSVSTNMVPSSQKPSKGGSGPSMVPDEIQKWLLGETAAPDTIRSLGTEITSKMNWAIALVLINQFARLPNLLQCVREAEQRLYSDNDMDAMTTEEIITRYKGALGASKEVLEFIRKFTIQNSELLSSITPSSEDESAIFQMLRSAPVEKLRQIKKLLQEG